MGVTRIMAPVSQSLGRGAAADAPARAETATEYNGYLIRPALRRQGSGWLIAGSITKAFSDGLENITSSAPTPTWTTPRSPLLHPEG